MSDYLIHYGVKGMKWGVRKQRPTSGRSRLRRSHNAQMRDTADLRKRGYKKESSPGMSTKKKVAIAATVVGVAAVGTGLAIYGKKTYGSLNPRKIAAGRELANRISGRSNDVALKSIKNYSIHTSRLTGDHYAIKTSSHGFGRNKYFTAKGSHEPGSLYSKAQIQNKVRVMGSEPHVTVNPYVRKAKINTAKVDFDPYAGIVGVNTKKPRIRR